jgi:GT2 family glycosyltransferase
MNPLISIITVNYNGKKWLKSCFDSLLAQTYRNFEIIVVDNASVDDSVEFIKKNYPSIKIVKSKNNLGTAGGNNLGEKHAKGEYILLLNNDTYVEKDFLEKFIKAFEKIPNLAVAQSKLVLIADENILDSCGSFWTDSSFLYHVGNGKDSKNPLYNTPFPVFSVKSASAMIKRSVIKKIGFYDEDFWYYYEETDFCHRAWLAGYQSWYWPSAITHHAVGGTALTFNNAHMQFHNFKNKLLSFLLNFEAKNLLLYVPVYLLLNFFLSIVWLAQGKFQHVYALYHAIFWNIQNFGNTMTKRKNIQRLRKMKDSEYFAKVKKNPNLNYYFALFSSQFQKYQDDSRILNKQ